MSRRCVRGTHIILCAAVGLSDRAQEGCQLEDSDLDVLSFNPVINYLTPPPRLTTLPRRTELLMEAGVDRVETLAFTAEFAAEVIFLINSQKDEATSQAQETIDGKWLDAKVGDIIFLQSNSLHGIRNTGKETCTYFAFQFE